MTAEQIAAVIADMQTGRVVPHEHSELARAALASVEQPTVVDCTPIYRSLADNPRPVYLYEDHPSIAPPFNEAAFAYVNEHGNVIVMHAFDEPEDHWSDTAEPVDWDRVRWRLQVVVWVGGRSRHTGKAATVGPVHMWKFAIYEDGAPADLRWVQIIDRYPMKNWDMAHLVVLGALNFLNCVNVQIVEPARPRPERRRLARTGIRVNEIVVSGLSRAQTGRSGDSDGSQPLTSVRGHFAHYGEAYGRGRLFGKYEGRYWIPQHARGNADAGETEHTYRIEP